MSLGLLHDRLSVTCALFTFAIGLWALGLFVRKRGLSANFLGAVAVGEGLLVVQGLIGAVLMFGEGLQPARWVHLLYGLLAALIWPFLFTYTRQTPAGAAPPRLEAALWCAGSFFLWGLVMRAITTAGGLR